MSEEALKSGRPMHAALYIGSLTLGGAERVMVNLAEALFARGWEVTLVTTYLADEEYPVAHAGWKRAAEDGSAEDGEAVQALTPEDRSVSVVLFRGPERVIRRVFSGVSSADAGGRITAFRRRRDRLSKIWDDIKPDVILSFIGKNNLMALSTAKRYHIPVIVSVRATPVEEYPTRAMQLAANSLFPRAAAVAVQSKAAGEWFSPRVQKRAVVMVNAVAEGFLRDDPAGERAKSIVAVGRMDANKNFGMLLRAFARLIKEDPALKEYQLLLYGDGEDRKKLEAEAETLGLTGRAVFEGRQQNIADRIRNAGIYCLMSDHEGMPNTLIEAMCLGLPCIATDCIYGGMSQLVTDGVDVLVIPPRDEEALMRAIRRLVHEPELASRLGAEAKKLRERYNPARVTDTWERMLADAAAGKPIKKEPETCVV